MFSGGGGVEALLKEQVDFLWAIESEADIAAVYRHNYGNHVIVGDVCDQDYGTLPKVDYLHASPVCKNASQAKTDGVESDTDIQTAEAVCRALRAVEPRVFTLENVWGYRTFEAFCRICRTLDQLGYMWHYEHVNSAVFGVPQTRRRLILRAVQGALLPNWPAPEPWVGWYTAIGDILDTLPASQFAPWQIERLPENLGESFLIASDNTQQQWGDPCGTQGSPARTIRVGSTPRAFLVGDQSAAHGTGVQLAEENEPAFTITTRSRGGAQPRAFIVDQQNGSRDSTVRQADEPIFTPTQYSTKHPTPRAWLSQGKVVKMNARALARFQSLPDSYILPEKSSLACTIIGNAVPSLMMLKIVGPLL